MAEDFVQICRDPFARHDVIRVLVPEHERKTCEWCGNKPGRFRYGIWSDGGRKSIETKAFCSKSCRDSYSS